METKQKQNNPCEKKTLVLVVLFPKSRYPHVRTPETKQTNNCYYSITPSQPFSQRGQCVHHLYYISLYLN